MGHGGAFQYSRRLTRLMDKPLWGLKVQAPLGARVLSFVCCAPNDGFGPQSGLVQRGVLYAAAWGSKNHTTALRASEMQSPFGGWRHHLSSASGGTITRAYCRDAYEESVSRCFILPPLAGEVRRSRIGGGERSEPISRMLTMPYDTESQSRNADFISIAAERQSATL